jgi:exodeoxyribonuclease V gamma subunit
MLHLHLSNRPEALAAALAEFMRAEPLPLLEVEPVLAPSTAASRWLEFRLADALGIATRTAFPFAAAYVWQLFGRVLPEVAQANPFERAALQWRLMRLLPASAAPQVRRYLAGDDGTRCLELAGRLAALFERYLVERPDWIAAWNGGRRLGLGPDEAWQAETWRALMRELPDVAAEHPRERFFGRLQAEPGLRQRLPRRISLWCVEAMPALYWEVFAGLAEWLELHVFVLAPSREYWGDIERKRERLRIELDHPGQAALYETGQPLLASLGRARRHVAVRLADAVASGASAEHAYFVAPPATLLGNLQRDILDLAAGGGIVADDTLQVHACHGPQREAEVLHDRLLALFEKLPGLTPADILILTPDIETYAPAVEAVLTHAPAERRIPCAVADRPRAAAPLWRAFRALCGVAAGELDAESVMALLEEAALRRAFAIEEGELPLLRDWVADAGIRWAEDGRARRRRGLPAEEAHTWRAGLRRLLLGIALPDAPERIVGGILPVAGVEGSRAELLGRFVDFCEALFDLAEKVGAGETAPQWSAILGAALERFLLPDEAEEQEMQRLRAALDALATLAREARCDSPLPLQVFLREVDALLAERAPARAFAGGAATIAALQPGRPLPVRVVCLVGMNDGTWPRPAPRLGFDLVARHPRPGDRNRRGEERYAFLETLLCARDALLVTYSGRDARSNVEQPPAAPLAELLDTLSAMTGRSVDELVLQHPLQPFGSTYFDGTQAQLFSFDAEHCPPGARREAAPFLSAVALPAAEGGAAVDVDVLRRFLLQPLRHFLRERLGIHLEASEELLETSEPFAMDGLGAYRLREACFAGLRNGETAEETARLLAARGWLPHGVAGEIVCAAARDAAAPLWEAARSWVDAQGRPPCEVIFESGGTALSGQLSGLTEKGLLRVRHGKTRAKDLLALWLDHLLLQIAAPADVERRSLLVAQDGATLLEPAPRAAEYLADLLAVYRVGMAGPLLFYPETAWAWLQERSDWLTKWNGNAYQNIPGERDDPYIALALRDSAGDPLGADFERCAARILGPLREALAERKAGDD